MILRSPTFFNEQKIILWMKWKDKSTEFFFQSSYSYILLFVLVFARLHFPNFMPFISLFCIFLILTSFMFSIKNFLLQNLLNFGKTVWDIFFNIHSYVGLYIHLFWVAEKIVCKSYFYFLHHFFLLSTDF